MKVNEHEYLVRPSKLYMQPLTQVCHANTARKVQEASTIAVRDIRSLALGYDTLDLPREPLGDVLLPELDKRRMRLRRYTPTDESGRWCK